MLWATKHGYVDIVRMLLDRGASVDATDDVSQPACLAAPPSTLHRRSRAQAAADGAWPGEAADRDGDEGSERWYAEGRCAASARLAGVVCLRSMEERR